MRPAILAFALAAAVVTACDRGLPPTIVVEDVVADLDVQPPDVRDAGVESAEIAPGDALRGQGARPSLTMPPGTAARWRVAVPERSFLRVAVGVAGDGRRDESRAAVRFAVAVDNAVVFTRDVNPAATRHDRRWFDEHIDLSRFGGNTIELTLSTETTSGERPAGVPGWSRIHVVQRTEMPRQAASVDRPNVVVIVIDTLRADAVGARGAEPSVTPVLDELTARGLSFDQAVSQSSWTLQSVSSLMTGLHSRAHGALGRHDHAPRTAAWGVLADSVVTWAETAARAGITTVAVSANPLVSRGTNLAQGFETFVELAWDPEGRDWPDADAVNEAFLRWLRGHGGHRFAAYLHYMEPHDPYTPQTAPVPPAGVRPAVARGWLRELANQVNWLRGAVLSDEEVAHLRARYRGEVAAADAGLGRLLDGLGALRGRTVVVMTSDHGEEFLEHGRLVHGSHLYDETVRVPLILQGPGIPAARRSDQAQGIDLFPTLARLLGLDAPPGLPGNDLLGGATKNRPAILETSSGIGPTGARLDVVAVRTTRGKVIETPALGRREVYDLETDAAEGKNRGGSTSESAALLAALDAWRAATPLATSEGGPSDLGERLRALGYAQ